MGSVKVDEVTGFSHALAPQLLVAVAEEEVVVAACRGSMARSGRATFAIDSILLRTCGTRGPNLIIFAASPFSMLAEASRRAAKPRRPTSDG
jgi:hypothetical protein